MGKLQREKWETHKDSRLQIHLHKYPTSLPLAWCSPVNNDDDDDAAADGEDGDNNDEDDVADGDSYWSPWCCF